MAAAQQPVIRLEVSVNGQSVNDLLEGGPQQVCGVVNALSLDRQALLDSRLDPEQLRSTWDTVDENLEGIGDVVAFVEGIEGFQSLGESVDIESQRPVVVAGFEERLALLEEAGFDGSPHLSAQPRSSPVGLKVRRGLKERR